MELVNAIYAATEVDREAVESVVRLLAPMAPHLSEELWQRLGHGEAEMLVTHPWPSYDPARAAKRRIQYPVQVNGKLRGQLEAEPDAGRDTVESQARALGSVKPWLDGKELVKVVFVPGRLINFVVRA
jgi:leucyl-tRNA synthetase